MLTNVLLNLYYIIIRVLKMAIVPIFGGLFAFVLAIIMFVAWWKILSKAGYPGLLAVLFLIPVVGQLIWLIMMLILGYSQWPALKKQKNSDQYKSAAIKYKKIASKYKRELDTLKNT